MPNFMAFAWYCYEPSGGLGDLVGRYKTREAARLAVDLRLSALVPPGTTEYSRAEIWTIKPWKLVAKFNDQTGKWEVVNA